MYQLVGIVNELTGGGLELGVVVVSEGIGKSWGLVVLGADQEKVECHSYSLELNESYVGLRYDASFTEIGKT